MQLDQPIRQKITQALELGMPLKNVADYVGVDLKAIRAEMSNNPRFKAEANKAIADCMHARLTTLEGLKNWQAIAFILESLWPRKFGRKRRQMPKVVSRRISSTGVDFSRLTPDQKHQLDDLLALVYGQQRLLPDPTNPGGPSAECRAGAD
jgi:hypothetical protein